MATATSSSMLAIGAHQQAVRALIRENQERYEELRREKRVALGLSPVPGGKSPDTILKQIEKAQEKIDKLNAELAKLNGG